MNSYEEFIIEKCFKTFATHISKGEYLTKEEFLNEIKNDKAFERFIYLYVLIKEYWHAQEGTIVDIDYTMEFEDSLFKNYLIWGAQAGNYYAGLIAAIERQTYSVDQEILDSISNNKYYIYETFSMGKDTYIENAQAFFNKYSIEDFEHNNWKVRYLLSKSELELELQNKKDPEKWIRMIENIDEDLPDNFYSQRKIELYKESSRLSLYSNNYEKASFYINELFNFLKIEPVEYLDILENVEINPIYYDVHNSICGSMGRIYMTDAYFDNNFDLNTSLEKILDVFSKCYANPDNSLYKVDGAKMWFGLVSAWYEDYRSAYSLLSPSKYPLHFGGNYAKTNDLMVPAFFNYAAMSAIEENLNLNIAEEFLWHASDAVDKNPVDNNFHAIFNDLLRTIVVYKKNKPLQASKLLKELKELMQDEQFDLGSGYFIDEDIDIFINKFLDISFQLKSINPDYFVDPLFLFEIKNKIFQTENLSGLRKNLDEDEYNNVLEKLERLRKEEIELENQILESSDLNTYELNTRLSALENDISSTRKQLFNLKANLKSFYGTSRTEYKELRERLEPNEVILFYNFALGSGRVVEVNNNNITLHKLSSGRNKVRNLISKIRNSIEMTSGKTISSMSQYDFDSSKSLYHSLFKELDLRKYDTVFTFSNEILNSLPMQTIVSDFNKEDKGWEKYYSAKWLNQSYKFAILESLSKKPKEAIYKNKFIGIGDPDLSSNPYFDNLPSTKQELIDIAQASGASSNDLYMKEQANIKNFKQLLQSKSERIVIASHAFSSNSFPLTKEAGIALHGDNIENSFITASEIAQLEINSDWVVLSACDTGYSKESYSKNYTSLAKAFLAAGVDSVLISNWNIETNSSARITKQIFNEIWFDETISKHQALRNSSESLRKDLSKQHHIHPAFWGAYSIVYDSI